MSKLTVEQVEELLTALQFPPTVWEARAFDTIHALVYDWLSRAATEKDPAGWHNQREEIEKLTEGWQALYDRVVELKELANKTLPPPALGIGIKRLAEK